MGLTTENDEGNEPIEIPPGYQLLGQFEPRDAERILKRLEAEQLSFQIEAYRDFQGSRTSYRSQALIRIYVWREHMPRAGQIVFEEAQP